MDKALYGVVCPQLIWWKMGKKRRNKDEEVNDYKKKLVTSSMPLALSRALLDLFLALSDPSLALSDPSLALLDLSRALVDLTTAENDKE